MRNQELHPRTAVINKSQKNKSRMARMQALAWLAEQFPKAFNNTSAIYPLKTGIMEDILVYAEKAEEAGISRSKLREAVVVFTRRVDYLACLKAREMRIDLEGNPVEEVTELDAERASQKIKKRIEKSVKNARKNLLPSKTLSSLKPAASNHYQTGIARVANTANRNDEHFLPVYPQRPQLTATTAQVAKAETIVVKHKTTRAFDPDAVARLKEKLGLSRKLEEQQEVG